MIIKVDVRETELIRCIKYVLEISPMYKDVQMVVENLPLGDIILSKNEIDKVVIERKSLRDLAASIKDGRYEEQSFRLNGLPIHNHNIVYLVEGDVNKFNVFKDRMEKLTLYSAMVSLNFYKGFSVMRSFNVEESALILCNMAHKINKCETDCKTLFYSQQPLKNVDVAENEGENMLDTPLDNYCTVAKKVKKDNVTPQNIGEIMLSQIPGVSSTTAIALMEKFGTLQNLVIKINENQQCLKDLSYTNSKGQTRKINKTALNNVINYLQPNVKDEKGIVASASATI
jgi:ERCC4-type nuclease